MKGYSPSVLRTYSRALLECLKDSEVENALNALKLFGKLMQVEMFREVINNPVVSMAMKEKILVETVEISGYKTDRLIDFIRVLLEKGRVSILESIWRSFESLAYNRARISKAVMVSAFEVDPATMDEIKKVLERVLARPVEIESHVDRSLIAGARIYVEDKILDLSAKGQLEKISRMLISEER